MGGMRALEWAVGHPDRVGGLVALATCAAASAEQIAWCAVQTAAIRSDPHWHGGDFYDAPPGQGPTAGLGIARRLAHVTYRSEAELEARFGREPQPGEDPAVGGRYAIESYLDHHAAKLARRFDAGSYVVLTESMNAHDVGRGRGGVEAALARVTAPTMVVGIDSDRLYPVHQQAEIASLVPHAMPLQVVASDHGHDGFLTETATVGALVRGFLDEVHGSGTGPARRTA
jgi:homoserine O-acetyltransferase